MADIPAIGYALKGTTFKPDTGRRTLTADSGRPRVYEGYSQTWYDIEALFPHVSWASYLVLLAHYEAYKGEYNTFTDVEGQQFSVLMLDEPSYQRSTLGPKLYDVRLPMRGTLL